MKSQKKLKKKVWEQFSLYVRLRDAARDKHLLDGEAAFCITCGKPYPIRGKGCLQAGHFIGGRNNQVLFDERQVFSQCYNCNINLKGAWPKYLKKMRELYGYSVVEDMISTHGEVKKYSIADLEELLEHYKEEVRKLDAP